MPLLGSFHTHLLSCARICSVGCRDRVGVLRTLQLDVTLCHDADGGGWRLSLSEPEQHKTSKIFGCSSTALNATCAAWLDRYLELACVPSGGYLFYADADPTAPLSPQDWTRLVQRAYAKHSGVKLCPKDLRTRARIQPNALSSFPFAHARYGWWQAHPTSPSCGATASRTSLCGRRLPPCVTPARLPQYMGIL